MASPTTGVSIRAWKPPVAGIREVLHGRFTDHAYPPHTHDAWTVFIVDDGAIRYDLDGRERGAEPSMVSVLPPHVVHDGRPATSRGFEKRVLYLDTSVFGEHLIGPAVDLPIVPDRSLHRRVAALHATLGSLDDVFEAETRLAFVAERIRAGLGDPAPWLPASRGLDLAEEVRAFLDAHAFEPVTMAALARELGSGPTQLARAFSEAYGIAPHVYLVGRRLDAARDRILRGQPLADVAAEVGFFDQAHLTRRFKRFLGTTPARFAGRWAGPPRPARWTDWSSGSVRSDAANPDQFGHRLLVELRRDEPLPLHRQLERELRTAIRLGRLTGGSALPSTRLLAEQLDVSRGIVVEAYEQLIAEGYLTSRPGGATRVSPRVTESAGVPVVPRAASAPRIDFVYGRPDVTQFPRQVWLRSLRRVLAEAPSDRLSYLDHRGAGELREALATYLNRVRGTAADAERIVICNGFAQALGLVAQVVRAMGGRRIAVEDPGQRDAVRTAGAAGLEVVPVPVDDEGIVVETLARADPDAVILTPAHHFPTGAVLSAERRAALVSWARGRDRLVLEDDYDAEYRYDREPIGAIQGLAPDQIIYAGSASKTLAPGLRLGWLIVPPALVDAVAEMKEATDRGSASLEQLAFADFLSRGEFDRHLRRMRPIYRARRDALLDALHRHLPALRPVGASAGLHVLAWLPPGVDEAAIVERSAALGVAVDGVTPYRIDGRDRPGGLLFGYGAVSGSAIDEGVRLIASTLD